MEGAAGSCLPRDQGACAEMHRRSGAREEMGEEHGRYRCPGESKANGGGLSQGLVAAELLRPADGGGVLGVRVLARAGLHGDRAADREARSRRFRRRTPRSGYWPRPPDGAARPPQARNPRPRSRQLPALTRRSRRSATGSYLRWAGQAASRDSRKPSVLLSVMINSLAPFTQPGGGASRQDQRLIQQQRPRYVPSAMTCATAVSGCEAGACADRGSGPRTTLPPRDLQE